MAVEYTNFQIDLHKNSPIPYHSASQVHIYAGVFFHFVLHYFLFLRFCRFLGTTKKRHVGREHEETG